MSRSQSSLINSCFTPRNGNDQRKCRKCSPAHPASYKAGTAPTNLGYHLWQHHRQVCETLGILAPRQSRAALANASAPPSSSSTESIESNDDVGLISVSSSAPLPFSSSPLSISLPAAIHPVQVPSSFPSSSSSSSSPSSSSFFSPRWIPTANKRHLPLVPDFPSKRTRQSLIDPHLLVPVVKESVAECMADCFAVHSLPMVLADSPVFQRMLYAFRQTLDPPPQRRQVSRQFAERVKAIRPQVLNALRLGAGITVGIDGWTNVRHEKVVDLVPVSNGVAYYWDSIILKKRSTAKAQTKPVGDGLQNIMDQGVIVVGLVTDNEQVNYKLYCRLSKQRFQFLIHVPCAAHTLQLCVHAALALNPIIAICQGLDVMINAFANNKQLRIALSEMQKTLRAGDQSLAIIKHNATRWSSRQRAAERVIRLRPCLQPLVPQIREYLSKLKDTTLHAHTFDDVWWVSLETLTTFLKPFQIATDVVQSDASNLMDIYTQLILLVQHVDTLLIPHPLADARLPLRNIIRLHWDKHVNRNAVIMCATFSFDSNLTSHFNGESLDAAITWFTTWGARFVKEYSMSDESDDFRIRAILTHQLSAFKGFTSPFTAMQERKQILTEVARLSKKKWDPRELWNLYRDTVPEITACALALLSLTASEAAVERTFSKQGLVHSKLRNALSPESVQAQMFIAFNHRALQRKGVEPDGDVELTDSYSAPHYVTDLFLVNLPDDAILAAPEGMEVEQQAQGRQPEEGKQEDIRQEDLAEEAEDEDEEEEEEADEDQDDQEEEKEEEEPEEDAEENDDDAEEKAEREDPIQLFVKEYVAARRITTGYRWSGDNVNALQAAVISKGLTTTVDTVRMKIKAYVTPVPVTMVSEAYV